jgi:hypothetical protein
MNQKTPERGSMSRSNTQSTKVVNRAHTLGALINWSPSVFIRVHPWLKSIREIRVSLFPLVPPINFVASA